MARKLSTRTVSPKRPKSEELILAVTAKAFDNWRDDAADPKNRQRWWEAWDAIQIMTFFEKHGVMIPRSYAESSHGLEFRQPIAYLVVRRGDDEVFVYERLQATEEERLRGKFSLGIGGHVCLKDMQGYEKHDETVGLYERSGIIFRSLIRESFEEVNLIRTSLEEPGPYDLVDLVEARVVGAIDDRDFDVSRHHVGIVYSVQVGDVEVRETDTMRGRFMTIEEIRSSVRLENWSELILYKHLVR